MELSLNLLARTLIIAGFLAANASAIITTQSNYADPIYGTTVNGPYEGVMQLQIAQPGIGTYSCSRGLVDLGGSDFDCGTLLV